MCLGGFLILIHSVQLAQIKRQNQTGFIGYIFFTFKVILYANMVTFQFTEPKPKRNPHDRSLPKFLVLSYKKKKVFLSCPLSVFLFKTKKIWEIRILLFDRCIKIKWTMRKIKRWVRTMPWYNTFRIHFNWLCFCS